MDSERWERIQALFHRALAYSERERTYFLSSLNEDPALIADVRAMLGEDAQPVELFNSGLAHLAHAILHPPMEHQKFHPYRLVKLLGEGGMGVVYLAEHEQHRTTAAVKILRDAWISPSRRHRFLLEQRALAGLVHPHIAQLYEAHTLPDGTPWFAMEFVDGFSLMKHCRHYALAVPTRLRLFRSLCEAVRHAHQHQLIHRDLKPSNVLVSAEGVLKLLDFGIAQQLDAGQAGAAPWMTRSHAAPEQLTGEPTGVFTDVYALGIILYELLTDRLPFDASRRLADETVPVPVDATPELAQLCQTAMQREPGSRYPSVTAMIVALDDCLPLRAQAANAS